MELTFESRQAKCLRESACFTRRIQESVEAVVPDTEEDIARIAALQSGVLLKSKDLSGHGVLITGELRACVLVLPEGQTGLSSLTVTKPFSAEFELSETSADMIPQIALSIQAADARLINPRKLSVSFDLSADLSCYEPESVPVQTFPPEDCRGLHSLLGREELILPNAVCEKSFALTEQFSFPAGTPAPEKLLAQEAEILISDCQLIGSKAVVKGSAELAVFVRNAEGESTRHRFSAAFSQIVELGAESMEFCTVRPQLTGIYFDLVDSISGERVLEAEMHVLLQLVSRAAYSVSLVEDVYSNLMPVELQRREQSWDTASACRAVTVSAEESITLPEDCAELLESFPTLSRAALENGKLSAAVHLDLLYRTPGGELNAARRSLMLSADADAGAARLLSARLSQLEPRVLGKELNVRAAMEGRVLLQETRSLGGVCAVRLDEEACCDTAAWPSLTLVRPEGESLWELAKRYHSTVEAIEAWSGGESDGELLLIPKCV